MTGPEHYQAAERCIGSVEGTDNLSKALLAEAQVHATLAVAASNVIAALHSPAQFRAWREAVGDEQEHTAVSHGH